MFGVWCGLHMWRSSRLICICFIWVNSQSKDAPLGDTFFLKMPFPDRQNPCGLVGQTMNPQAPCGGYRAGPVFFEQNNNHIVPPGSRTLQRHVNQDSPTKYRGLKYSRWISEVTTVVHLRVPSLALPDGTHQLWVWPNRVLISFQSRMSQAWVCVLFL